MVVCTLWARSLDQYFSLECFLAPLEKIDQMISLNMSTDVISNHIFKIAYKWHFKRIFNKVYKCNLKTPLQIQMFCIEM